MLKKIVSWNVRGLGAPDKRLLVKRLIKHAKPEVIILQETKLANISTRDIREFTGSNKWESIYLPSIGTRGGIIILWDPIILLATLHLLGDYTVSVHCENIADGFHWSLTGVYGPTQCTERGKLWDELNLLSSTITSPWCIAGDFNTILTSEDKWGGSNITTSMRNFKSFIDRADFVDLPLKGALYTWSNGQFEGLVMNIIDRFLVSPDWMIKFPQTVQSALPRFTSDHKPLLLSLGGSSWGPSPFRFEDMWYKVEGFDELVIQWWSDLQFEGTSSFIFWCKLKALKDRLKSWNRNTLGRIDSRLITIQEQIVLLDCLEQQGPLTEDNFTMRLSLKSEFLSLAAMEEASWRQKARTCHLKEGDNNTKYFHTFANARRGFNSISALRVNGVLTTDRATIKSGIVDYYIKLYEEEDFWRPLLDQIQFPKISEFEKEYIERIFFEEEVFASIKELAKDKAPGPDGYPISFFLHFWDLIKTDYLALVADFHRDSYFDWRINATFITLLPKKNQVEELGDFRPISLLTSTYKVLAKTIASRLKLVMNKLVAHNQMAYIKGRNITDGILIANELVDSRLRSLSPGIICKVDMEKAFDRVSWSYIEYILSRMGFDWRWRSWVRQCLNSANFSILINGTPCGFFRSSRGVRQGDPISALIFDLAMEGLSQLLYKGTAIGRISGFRLTESGTAVSHLQYADDTIIFLNAEWDMIEYSISILKCFEAISGLRINIAKTTLIGIGDVPLLSSWANSLGRCTECLPTKYLGLPLGSSSRSITMWDPVLERLDKRLSIWNSKLLSKGGKLTLIKSTLSSLPLYYLSVFLAPKKVIHQMERKIRRFLWSNGETDKSYHLVKWESVCGSKENKGLGIKQLHLMNKALLSKWFWRFGSEVNALWRRLMVEKFGEGTRWSPNIPRISQGVGCWRRILTLFDSYSKDLVFEVHSGADIRFWQDSWLDQGPLLITSPQLFSISRQKKNSIKNMNVERDGDTIWNFSFNRDLNEFESEELNILLLVIGSPPRFLDNSHDICRWKVAPAEPFTVKKFYDNILAVSSPQAVETEFPYSFIWLSPVPSRVKFFVWTTCLNRCLTVDNLNKRGKFIVSRCPLCKAALETLDHILLHCEFSRTVWNAFLLQSGWTGCLPQWPHDLALSWKAQGFWSNRGKILWKILPIAVWWGLWLERNARTFQRVESNAFQVTNRIRAFIYYWCSILPECKSLTLTDITLNWERCLLTV